MEYLVNIVMGHCFHQGYAAEIPKSVVTLNTCSGLRYWHIQEMYMIENLMGLLQLENVSYGIEPLESAATYEHMLYQIKNNKIDFPPLRKTYRLTQLVDKSYRILVKSEYNYMGSEVAVAAEKVVHIFSLINSMISQLKVTVMLTSLEIWSDQNKISSNGDADEVLQRFVSWKEKFLSQRSHDMAYLLIRSHGTKFFSSCSMNEFKRIVSQPEFECLQNQAASKVVNQGRSRSCGNGILEPPEQCDCGLPEHCKFEKCCHPENCTLIDFSECGTGPCCDEKTCLVSERGILCRKSKDLCDFPEYCNGISEFCVPDAVSADLEPCSNKTAYCFGGTCRDPDVHFVTVEVAMISVNTQEESIVTQKQNAMDMGLLLPTVFYGYIKILPQEFEKKTLSKLLPRYLEMHIIVEKALYDYMGSEMMAVTQKIIQIIGLVNTNFSNLQPLYQSQSVCGNGILEPNEECDCGSEEECQFKKCCDYKTCKLKGPVKCGSGPCCTSKCDISVAGTPCRKSIDQECDFTEYCNGTSECIYFPFYTVFQMHCHYQGYVAEFPNSVATLSICAGLRGFFQFENISYGIEPLESLVRFEHIIYQVKNDNPDIPMLAENYNNISQKD
ncbi:hypothetical protein HPG69_014731 [Diceros bicornis minor]|uniref:Uncharacterized protein n=1 Tax=Diceros bicornis minor TaxID=77932 RepID=A0A7J7EYS1_DICBM|nr:hypothetical protein HPG69_014731 [Diceros bicornis minor]